MIWERRESGLCAWNQEESEIALRPKLNDRQNRLLTHNQAYHQAFVSLLNKIKNGQIDSKYHKIDRGSLTSATKSKKQVVDRIILHGQLFSSTLGESRFRFNFSGGYRSSSVSSRQTRKLPSHRDLGHEQEQLDINEVRRLIQRNKKASPQKLVKRATKSAPKLQDVFMRTSKQFRSKLFSKKKKNELDAIYPPQYGDCYN